jgi:hypothetical protein
MIGGNGERNENGKRPGDGLRRRRRGIVAVVAATALLAATAGLWATGTWPFHQGDSYCWGAWRSHEGDGASRPRQVDGADRLLGDRLLEKSGAERISEESPPPTADRPEGTCEVTVRERAGYERDLVTLSAVYGRVPDGEKSHRVWLAEYLDGDLAALPDGLDGVASDDRAMLVLPAACDVDGRPTTVTLAGRGGTGDEATMARLLVDLANTAMAKAGCAPDTPLSFTSPFTTLPRVDTMAFSQLCDIPGVRFTFAEDVDRRDAMGTYGTRLQICVARTGSDAEGPGLGAHYVMTGTPRLNALFTGLPEGLGRGLVRKTCDGRPTVFYGHPESLRGRGAPDDATAFAGFVASVSQRIGCDDGGER